jgi:hypothetical protein
LLRKQLTWISDPQTHRTSIVTVELIYETERRFFPQFLESDIETIIQHDFLKDGTTNMAWFARHKQTVSSGTCCLLIISCQGMQEFVAILTRSSHNQFIYVGLTCPTRNLPGPWYTRFTHLRLKRAVITGQRIFYIDALHKQYGPIVRLSPTEVGVADLDAFREIHKIGTKYMKSEWYLRLANFPKAGVFTMLDPREHGPRRKLLSRSFSRSYLVENWEPIVRQKALLAVTKIKADAVQGTADVYNWWMLLASDISAHLSFGESFRMLETGRVSSNNHFP